MFFLLINLIICFSFHLCFSADVSVFYTKNDENNIALHYIRENYVANFKVVNEREEYCLNFEDITIINNGVCALAVIFYPFLNKSSNIENDCLLKNHLDKNNNKITYLNNYMEIKQFNNIWVVSATKQNQKFVKTVIQSAPNFYYNIQTAIKNVMDFVEEEHFHECNTKKKVKRFAFISKISNDFVVMTRLYFICIIILLLGSLSIGIYLLIRHLITGTNQIINESIV
uniref:Col_cuticle_N domain-containing protein n=1 Tax=Strongyloides stercoralis TaxID=6248 RepID=A0A0K0ECR4_STRER